MTIGLSLGIAILAAGAIALVTYLLFRRRLLASSAAIVEANRRFKATFEQAAVGIAHLDAEGRWLRINARYCEIAGYSHDELMQLTVDDITHPLDVPRDAGTRAAMMAGELDRSSIEKRYVRKDGQVIWVNATRSTVRDAAGRPEFFVAVVEEITARKEAEIQLITGESQFRATFDSAVEAMAVIDAKGTIQSVNPALQRVFGYAPEELLGQNIKVLMPKSIADNHDDYLRRFAETGVKAIIGTGREVIGRRKDGSQCPLDLSVAEWQRDGQSYFTGVMRDITARKNGEAALRASEERLRCLQNEFAHLARVNDLGEMAAAIAHEINQPLTAIVNFLNSGLFILADGYSEDGVADTEELIRQASGQALRAGDIVRRLREFIGHGSGIRSIESADALVDSAVALALIDARSRGIAVDRRPGARNAQVEVDVVQIQQVMVNLLRNAVEAMVTEPSEFGPRLTITTRLKADRVEVEVADNGPGIMPKVIDQLFDPFVTTKSKGMGMGLSVCRRLIEAHGGEIGARSQPGGGAIFCFTLPQYRTKPA